jgi:hypothetical protein
MYCGHACSLVAVDVQAAAAAFEKLFNNPELRRQMGEAGKKRAQQVFDWKNIIGQYEALWATQTELRIAGTKDLKVLDHPWPARMDPFHAFASYPTQSLTPQTLLTLVDVNLSMAIERTSAYRQLAMVNFAKAILPTDTEIETVLRAASQAQSAQEIVSGIPMDRQAYVFRSLAWLLKLGVIKVA